MKPFHVLLIEDNPADVGLIREMLAESRDSAFELEHVDRLKAGLERIAAGGIDVLFFWTFRFPTAKDCKHCLTSAIFPPACQSSSSPERAI